MKNSDTIEIERYGKDAVVSSPVAVFSYQISDDNPRNWSQDRTSSGFDYSNRAMQMVIDGVEVLPYGSFNDLPQLLRDTVYSNPNAPTIFDKKQGLLWGKGPHLYKEVFEQNKLVRQWVTDVEIEAELDSWDFQSYLMSVMTDFDFMQASATKFVPAKSSLLGQKRFQSLEHLNPLWTRLAKMPGSEKATHVLFSQYWENNNFMDYKLYKMFDSKNPFTSQSVMYAKKMTFATEHYPIPAIYGALEWIRRSTAIPLILRALSKDSINAKYHITSPAKFWEDKRAEIEADCDSKNIDYDDAMLQNYERELFKTIISTLSGEDKVGKIWHTKNIMNADGMNLVEQGWTIKPIDQNIKDFVDTQIKVGDKADGVVSAVLGVHKSLAGITGDGKSDSGSEQLYAYLMYILTAVDIPEYYCMKAINEYLKFNFPAKGLKMGFYYQEAQKQQDTTSSQRIKNQPL